MTKALLIRSLLTIYRDFMKDQRDDTATIHDFMRWLNDNDNGAELSFTTDFKHIKMSEDVKVYFPENYGYAPSIFLYAENKVAEIPYFEIKYPFGIFEDHFVFKHQLPLPKGSEFFYYLFKSGQECELIKIDLESIKKGKK